MRGDARLVGVVHCIDMTADPLVGESPARPREVHASPRSGTFFVVDARSATLRPMRSEARGQLSGIELLTFDIDGTLTDATTWWAGEAVGWVQRYSVRDGEALLRLARSGVQVVPLSRNATDVARRRMEHLRCTTRWLGVSDKLGALDEIATVHSVALHRIVHIGDGLDDAPVFERVGVGVAVADAHPAALAVARLVLRSRGGERAVEELEQLIHAARAGSEAGR